MPHTTCHIILSVHCVNWVSFWPSFWPPTIICFCSTYSNLKIASWSEPQYWKYWNSKKLSFLYNAPSLKWYVTLGVHYALLVISLKVFWFLYNMLKMEHIVQNKNRTFLCANQHISTLIHNRRSARLCQLSWPGNAACDIEIISTAHFILVDMSDHYAVTFL